MWKFGRGKLGIFKPLFGAWRVENNSPMGRVVCIRTFEPILSGKFVQLSANWSFPDADRKDYDEHAIFGPSADGNLKFWSFTSDGKRSEGWLSNADDLAEKSVCFEADMDAGRARQVYWGGAESGTMHWVVESKTKKGWNRFVEHIYIQTK